MTAILNFILSWCEVWNQESTETARNSKFFIVTGERSDQLTAYLNFKMAATKSIDKVFLNGCEGRGRTTKTLVDPMFKTAVLGQHSRVTVHCYLLMSDFGMQTASRLGGK